MATSVENACIFSILLGALRLLLRYKISGVFFISSSAQPAIVGHRGHRHSVALPECRMFLRHFISNFVSSFENESCEGLFIDVSMCSSDNLRIGVVYRPLMHLLKNQWLYLIMYLTMLKILSTLLNMETLIYPILIGKL